MNRDQLDYLNADYQAVYGSAPNHFVCPILQVDEDVALCDGHVLPEKIENARRSSVIQREDVDNHFGGTIEPDLISYVNLAIDDAEAMINKASRPLSIRLPDGRETEAFFAGPGARRRFQQIAVTTKEGQDIAFPYLRDVRMSESMKDLEVTWLILLQNSAVTGSLVHSAFLAFFRLFGYEWVDTLGADKARRALKKFYDERSEGKAAARQAFSDFEGCTTVFLGSLPTGLLDTLEGDTFLLHFAPTRWGDMLFGTSCLFRVNNQMLVVTLPSYARFGHYLVAYSYYCNYRRNHGIAQRVVLKQLDRRSGQCTSMPLEMKYQSS